PRGQVQGEEHHRDVRLSGWRSGRHLDVCGAVGARVESGRHLVRRRAAVGRLADTRALARAQAVRPLRGIDSPTPQPVISNGSDAGSIPANSLRRCHMSSTTVVAPTTIERPQADEYYNYYGQYIAKVPDGGLISLLREQAVETVTML